MYNNNNNETEYQEFDDELPKGGKSKKGWVIGIILILVCVGIGLYFYFKNKKDLLKRAKAVSIYLPSGITPDKATESQVAAAETKSKAAKADLLNRARFVRHYLPSGVTHEKATEAQVKVAEAKYKAAKADLLKRAKAVKDYLPSGIIPEYATQEQVTRALSAKNAKAIADAQVAEDDLLNQVASQSSAQQNIDTQADTKAAAEAAAAKVAAAKVAAEAAAAKVAAEAAAAEAAAAKVAAEAAAAEAAAAKVAAEAAAAKVAAEAAAAKVAAELAAEKKAAAEAAAKKAADLKAPSFNFTLEGKFDCDGNGGEIGENDDCSSMVKGSQDYIDCAETICNDKPTCKGLSVKNSDPYTIWWQKSIGKTNDTAYTCYKKPPSLTVPGWTENMNNYCKGGCIISNSCMSDIAYTEENKQAKLLDAKEECKNQPNCKSIEDQLEDKSFRLKTGDTYEDNSAIEKANCWSPPNYMSDWTENMNNYCKGGCIISNSCMSDIAYTEENKQAKLLDAKEECKNQPNCKSIEDQLEDKSFRLKTGDTYEDNSAIEKANCWSPESFNGYTNITGKG